MEDDPKVTKLEQAIAFSICFAFYLGKLDRLKNMPETHKKLAEFCAEEHWPRFLNTAKAITHDEELQSFLCKNTNTSA